MYTCNIVKTHIPQLRVLITSKCSSRCVYCRPGGETFCTDKLLKPEEFVACIQELCNIGIQYIKISGGDPALRDDLPTIVNGIKKIPQIKYVELITRDPRIKNVYKELEEAGLDCLNFSLDTIDEEKWKYINGRSDFLKYLHAIKEASGFNFKIKINAVICMFDFDEIMSLIKFIQSLGGGTLKLLDLIDDIVDEKRNADYDFSKCIPIETIEMELKKIAIDIKDIFPPGGVGHPMKQFILSQGVDVITKSSHAGAYYHASCRKCTYFPCYDALMALRLTPDGKLQKCLLRNDNWFDLYSSLENKKVLEKGMLEMLSNYTDADFYSYERILELKNEK